MNNSILEEYGTNYTTKEYVTNPAIGREREIKELILLLLTVEKSAILVGKPGVGKTAIIEGLAYKMKIGEVPDFLKDFQIINIQTAAMLGTTEKGESKVQILIEELKKQPKTILFIDEIHMLMIQIQACTIGLFKVFVVFFGFQTMKSKMQFIGLIPLVIYCSKCIESRICHIIAPRVILFIDSNDAKAERTHVDMLPNELLNIL